MFRPILPPDSRSGRKGLSVRHAAITTAVLIAAALPARAAPAASLPPKRPAAPSAENEPEWSKPVAGLQCRLYLPPFDPEKTSAEDSLLFELRNAGQEPITLPLASGNLSESPPLKFEVAPAGAKPPGVSNGGDRTDARVRSAFAAAWRIKHDTKSDRDELALKLYREVWLGLQPYATPYNFHEVSPYPDDASAESILAGHHGDASTFRLWGTTEEFCVAIFSERPSAIIKALAADFQGDLDKRHKAQQVLSAWLHHLHHNLWQHSQELRAASPEQRKLDEIARELYPVVSKRFQELDTMPRRGGSEPLANVLLCLHDPRAIPILLGKDGRGLEYFENLSQLQRDNKADPALVKLLSDSNVSVREKAAYALAWSGDPSLVPHAIRLLGEKSPGIRRNALDMAWTLLTSHPQPELRAEVRALLRDPDREVRQLCVYRLAQLKDAECATVLLELLRDQTIHEVNHGNLVSAMEYLTGTNFGYHIGSDGWAPTTPNNRAAIAKFEAWIDQQHARTTKKSTQ
jgi:hypothetical protein